MGAGKPTVLLVDDDVDLQRAIKRFAEAAGYAVIQAFDGTDAMVLARVEVPDIIVLDVNMPGCDGRDVLAQLKRDVMTRSIPVVLWSSRAEQSDRHVGLQLGAADYLEKPCSPAVLMRKIDHLLDRAPR
jgi:DNA-binding response OmpR family regulator